ncbi:hypothetical protein X772_18810 [Mesorhizobium sp. LSJC280B00]|nr:hypothetical protein X772_18810 [Mesorhizobium sp. LSJC280B00]
MQVPPGQRGHPDKPQMIALFAAMLPHWLFS